MKVKISYTMRVERVIKMKIKIGWNRLNDPYWGYNYNENCDYHHELCFYKLYICWK